MSQSRIPSPARSQGAPVTPRRNKSRSRSVGSPARSNTSGRLSALVQFKENNKNSFVLSPAPSRWSLLNDDTDIVEPRRRSWWKKLADNSRDVMEVLNDNKILETNEAVEEYIDIEVLSQEKKNYSVDIPDSSDSESISSIVIPQRKLFTQKDQAQNKFGQLIGKRETLAKLHKSQASDKTVHVPPRNLFGHSSKPRAKPVFPAALLNLSPNKTVNKTKENVAAEVKGQVRTLFGNRAGTKRKNMFADFIVSESEDEISEIQPKVFEFPKKDMRRDSGNSRGKREHSPTSSVTTDIEMDDWKMLPSSTMVENQLEDMMAAGKTPVKRVKLSKLAEAKETETKITEATKNTNITDFMNLSQRQDEEEKLLRVPDQGDINYEDPNEKEENQNESYVNQQNEDSEEEEIENDQEEKIENDQEKAEIENDQEESVYQGDINYEDPNEKEENRNESYVNQQNEDSEEEKIENDQEEEIENDQEKEEIENDQEESEAEHNVSEIQAQNKSVQDHVHRDSVEKSRNESIAQVQNDQENDHEIADDVHESDQEESEAEHNVSEIQAKNKSVQDHVHRDSVEKSRNESIAQVQNDQENDHEIADDVHESDQEEEEQKDSEIENNDDESEVEMQNGSVEEQDDTDDEAQNESNGEEMNVQDESAEVQDNSDDEAQIESIEDEMDVQEEIAEVQDESDNNEQNESNEQEMDVLDESAEVQNDSDDNAQNESNEDEMDATGNESEELEEDAQNDTSEVKNEDEEQIESENQETYEDAQNKSEDEIQDSNNQPQSDQESQNATHDTTGRHRKKNDTEVNSPEAIRHDNTNQLESFTAQGRNTSIRKTTMLKNLDIRPSLAPPRESTGLSDGTRNSSADGSGWDSHRTTRKTLRQTFGRDFTPRKSLRALVMEKSAKRQTAINDMTAVTAKFPQANSTELPEASMAPDDDVEISKESNHDVSKRTRQTTLEMYLQKIKKQNMERRLKTEEAVRNTLQAPSRDILNPFKAPPIFSSRKAKKVASKPKAKPAKSTLIPLDDLPQEVIEDMKYKPPKRFQPSNASWITKRLYKFLESKLESQYDYKARVRAEKLVETIYYFCKDLRRVEAAATPAVDALKHEMARLNVVKTHFDFYQFFHEYMPREIRVKVVPDVVNKINMPRHGVFSDIIRGNTVQG